MRKLLLKRLKEVMRNSQDEVVAMDATVANAIPVLSSDQVDTVKELKHEIETLLDNYPDPVSRYDLNFRYTFVNAALERVLGHSADYFIGRTKREVEGDTPFIDTWESILKEVVHTKKEKHLEFSVDKESGSRFMHGLFVPEIGADGKVRSILVVGRDLTERKSHEDMLEQMAENGRDWGEKYKAIIKSSGQILYEWNSETHTTKYFGNIRKILGYSANEISGNFKQWLDLVHPDDVKILKDAIKNSSKENHGVKIEYRVKRKSGKYIYVEDKGYYYTNSKGVTVGMLGFVEDITARKRAEAELRQYASELSEWKSKYEALIHASGQIIFHYDHKTKSHISFDGNVTGILGYTAKELIGANSKWLEKIHPDDLKKFMSEHKSRRHNHGAGRIEMRVRKKNGEYTYIEDNSYYLFDEKGKITGSVGYIVDISDRKRAEEALLNSSNQLSEWKSRYEALIRASGQIIFYYDSLTRHHTHLEGNVTEILGYKSEELIGAKEKITNLIHPDDRDMFYAAFDSDAKKNRRGRVEFRMLRKDGEYINVEETFYYLFDKQKKQIGITGFLVDITERKVAEEKLLQKERERKEWEQQYSALALATGQVTFFWDTKKGLHVRFDGDVEKLTAYTTAELLEPRKWNSIVFPDDFAETDKVFFDALNAKSSYQMEYRIIRKDGSIRYVEEHGYFKCDENGEVVMAVGFLLDTTERKKAQEELLTWSNRYEAMIKASGQIVYEWIPNAQTLILSGDTERITGYKKEEISGDISRWDRIVHPADIKGLMNAVEKACDEKVPFVHEYRIIRKDGKIVYVEDKGYLTKELQNGRYSMIGFLADITRRKVREEEIKYQARLLNIVERSIIATDLNGIIVSWNDYAEEVFGWQKEEIVGKVMSQTSGLHTPEPTRAEIRKAITAGGSWSGELPETKKDGTVFPARVTISPVYDTEGELVGSVSVINDVTQEKKILKALEDSEHHLRTITENMREAIYVYDLSRHLIFVNSTSAVEYLTGYKGGKIPDDDFLSYVHPDDQLRLAKAFSLTLEGANNQREEARVIRKDGKVRWHAFSFNPFFRENHEQTGVEVVEWGINRLKLAKLALQESESRYRSLVELSPDAIILTDMDGKILLANHQAVKLYGYRKIDDLIGTDAETLITAEDRERAKQIQYSCIQKGRSQAEDFNLKRNDGSVFHADISASLTRDVEGFPTGFIMVARDITARKKSENALRETNQMLETLVDANPLAVISQDVDRNVTLWNKAAERIFGWKEEEVIGKEIPYVPDDRLEEAKKIADSVHLGQVFTDKEAIRKRKDGSLVDLSISAAPLRDAQGKITGSVAVIADITGRKRSEKQIYDLAFYDHLTKLPNRTLFQDRLGQTLTYAHKNKTKVGVMFIDLDRFKTINDSLGHNTGDRLLKEVSDRLVNCVKDTDTVSRQGGDEFTMILSDLEQDESAIDVARRVLDSLSDPFMVDNHEVFISPSIGISMYPNDSSDPDTLIRFADVAMYTAKRRGGNIYQFYTADMNAKVLERLTLENNLRRAIRGEEFVIYYQPKLDLATGKIIAVESLVRWNSRELGLVSPLKFIPIAEETGLITAIDSWVLNTSCKQVKYWQKHGFTDLSVAVNLSARDLHPNIVNVVRKALETSRLDPKYLELEITESSLMEVDENILSLLHDLRALGITIAVDDFGTGYSSLSRLKDLPIDALKIDQSFIRKVSYDEKDEAIISSIIMIGHNLNLRVTAEGAENDRQVQFLKEKECDLIQGYFVSPPLAGDDLFNLLRQTGVDNTWVSSSTVH